MKNYIVEIKAFQEFAQDKQLSTGQIALWYALMYLNNRCSWSEWFTVASLSLISNCGLSRDGVIKARNKLKQYGLIDFKTNGTKATAYKIYDMQDILQAGIQVSLQDNNTMQDILQVSLQDSLQVGLQDSLQVSTTLIKLNKTKQNKTKEKEKESMCVQEHASLTPQTPKQNSAPKAKVKRKPKTAIVKKQYAEFVTLKEAEYNTLVTKHGEEATKAMIDKLDNYKGAHGATYASDYRAILTWVQGQYYEDQKKQTNNPFAKNSFQVLNTQQKSINPFTNIRNNLLEEQEGGLISDY